MSLVFTIPAYAVIVAVVILLHHRYKHANDPMTNIDKWFQVSDVSNHETWIVAMCFFAVGFVIASCVK